MERKIKLYILLSFILSILLFSGCSSSGENIQTPESSNITDVGNVQTPESTDIPVVGENQKMGNTNSNIWAGGHSVLRDDWIYFMNFTDNNFLYKIKTDGTGETKVVDDKAYYLNTYGDYLYYCNGSDDGRIYKIKPDGTGRAMISDAQLTNMIVSEDWIYFIDYTVENGESDIGRIFRIRTDGTEKQKISEHRANSFNISDDWIYYFNEDEQKIFRVKADGSEDAKVSDASVSIFNVLDNDIYYMPHPYESGLYKMKTDGSGDVRISDDKIRDINVSEDWIYYLAILNDAPKSDDDKSDPVMEFELKKMRLDGSAAVVINDFDPMGIPMGIHVNGDSLMYVVMDSTNANIKQTIVKTDGTEIKNYALKQTPPDQNVEQYPEQEPVKAGDLTITVISSYSTNVFEVDDLMPIDGAYLFVNMTVTNESANDIDLENMTGITIGNTTYLSQLADITDRPGKSNISFHLTQNEYSSNLILKSGEKKEVQALYYPNERTDPFYLSIFDSDGRDTLAKIEITPNEEYYLATKDSSMKIMEERFPGSKIALSNRIIRDTEGNMYYAFEVKKAGSAEAEYYLMKRDTEVLFIGEVDANDPTNLIPGKPLD